jgi:hypothetical protein
MSVTVTEQVKTNSTGFRALGPDAMSEGLLRVFGHKVFEFSPRSFVFLICFASPQKNRGKFGPDI